MRVTIEKRRLLLLLAALLSNAGGAHETSANPPVIMPRMTMMTHSTGGHNVIFFADKGKRLGLVVVPIENTDAVVDIAKAPKHDEGKNSRGGKVGGQTVIAARDAIVDGSMFREKDAQSAPRMTSNAFVRGGERTAPVMVYDVTSGTQIARWGNGRVTYGYDKRAVAMSPDSKTLVCAAERYACLDLWDIDSGTLRTSIDVAPDSDGYAGSIGLALTPDSKYLFVSVLVVTRRSRVVRRYDLSSGQPIEEFTEIKSSGNYVPNLALSPDGRFLAKSKWIWDVNTGEMVCELQVDERYFGYSMFTPDSKQLLSNSRSDGFTIIDLMRGSGATRAFPNRDYDAFDLSPNGSIVALYEDGEYRDRVLLYDLATRHMIAQLAPVWKGVESLRFSPDGRTLAASCEDGATRLWDVSLFSREQDSQ